MKRSETRSETRTALFNAVKRTVKHTEKHTEKHSAKRCFTVRFTASYSAVRVSLHPTALHVLCAYLDERAEVVQCADSALVGACIFCFGEFNAGIHL